MFELYTKRQEQPMHSDDWILVKESTGKPIKIGAKIKTFRNETVVVTGWRAPLHSNSTGRVYVKWPGQGITGEFFPAVINAKLVRKPA